MRTFYLSVLLLFTCLFFRLEAQCNDNESITICDMTTIDGDADVVGVNLRLILCGSPSFLELNQDDMFEVEICAIGHFIEFEILEY